jgi:hypothetical protein
VLGKEWAESIQKLADELTQRLADRDKYPFLTALEPLRDLTAAMIGKPATWYITEPVKQEDALLDAKERVLDKVRSFMSGPQRGIYDDVRSFLQGQDTNIGYVDAAAGDRLRAALRQPDCYIGTAIQALKADLYALKDKVELAVLGERKAVILAVDDCAARIAHTAEYQALAPDQQDRIRRGFDNHKAGLDQMTMIPILREKLNVARSGLMQQVLRQMAEMNPPKVAVVVTPGLSDRPAPAPSPAPAPQSYVNAADIRVAYPRPYLAEVADVEQYVNELRKTLLAEIGAGRKVIV